MPPFAFGEGSVMIFINHPSRLTRPYLTVNGEKKILEWEDAVQTAADSLQRLSAEGKGMGFIVSPRVTNEELFLISRIAGLFKEARVASSAFYHTGKIAAAFRKMGIGFPAGRRGSPSCDLIIVAGADLLINNHLLANKVRETVMRRAPGSSSSIPSRPRLRGSRMSICGLCRERTPFFSMPSPGGY